MKKYINNLNFKKRDWKMIIYIIRRLSLVPKNSLKVSLKKAKYSHRGHTLRNPFGHQFKY
jgi:hypothetical protein